MKAIKAGDEVEADLTTGIIHDKTTGESFTAEPFPEFIRRIIDDGGLLNNLAKRSKNNEL